MACQITVLLCQKYAQQKYFLKLSKTQSELNLYPRSFIIPSKKQFKNPKISEISFFNYKQKQKKYKKIQNELVSITYHFETETNLNNNLGKIYIAKQMQEKINEQILSIYKEIAIDYKLKGNYQKSLTYFNNCFTKYSQDMHQNSQNYIQILIWIGRVQINKGENQKALEIFQQIKITTEKTLGKKNKLYVHILQQIGVILSIFDRNQEAPSFFQQALKIGSQINDYDLDKIEDTFHQIAICLIELKNYDQAIKKLNQITQLKRNLFNDARFYSNLGNLCLQMKNYQVAAQNFKKCLKIRKKIYSNSHPKVASTSFLLGQSYLKLQKFTQVYQYIIKETKIMEQNGKNNYKCYYSLMILGQIYVGLNQYDDALKYLLSAQQKIIQFLLPNHLYRATVLLQKGKIYRIRNQLQQSYSNLIQCLQIRKNVFQQFDEEYQQTLEELNTIVQLMNKKNQRKEYQKILLYNKKQFTRMFKLKMNNYRVITKQQTQHFIQYFIQNQ